MICWNLCLCLPPRGNQNPIVKNCTRLFINWIKINKENKQTENTIPNDEQQQKNYIVIKRANNTLIMLWLHAFGLVINAKKIAMRFDRRAFDWNFRTRKNNNTLFVCVCVLVSCYYLKLRSMAKVPMPLNSNISIISRLHLQKQLIC